ncbi:MAG TPA: DnaA/Hda family protein, partial [Kofleriaceae bacterium]|nr:DnaA/Hda family protein [Kofleriaceae bacterium]
MRLWFESNYLGAVLDELRAETEQEFAVEFDPESEPAPGAPDEPDPAASPVPEEAAGAGASAASAAPAVHAGGAAGPDGAAVAETTGSELDFESDDPPLINIALNPRYTFESFVAGPSNQLAYAAAQAAAST